MRPHPGPWRRSRQASNNDAAAIANVVGTIPLSHETIVDTAVTLSVALMATGDDDGRLVLRWGHHRWSADFGFAKPPPPPRREKYERHGTFDEDPAERARALMLTARHETALTLPDDSRIAVLFGRSIGADHDDFAAIADMNDGEVLRLTKAAVIRLRTEVPLTFGAVAVPTDNWAPGFPGSYGLWLKRAGREWTLVFNHEADAWGTQHDPQFDAAETDVGYSKSVSSTYPLGVALIPTPAGPEDVQQPRDDYVRFSNSYSMFTSFLACLASAILCIVVRQLGLRPWRSHCENGLFAGARRSVVSCSVNRPRERGAPH